VDVSDQNIYINGLASRLGEGLQSVAASAELGEPNHGGTTVHIEVDDTTRAYISASALVAGGKFIDVPLLNGDAEALFYLQAHATGQVTVTATAGVPFANTMQVVDIVPAGIRIIELADSIAVSDDDDEFVVQVGAINSDSTDIVVPQALRGGGPSRTISVASSDGALASIVLGPTLDDAVLVTLDPGEFESPSPVAAGGLALSPWSAGTVTVTASASGFLTTAAGAQDVLITGTATGAQSPGVPRFALEQNVPNPFNPTTTIAFSVPQSARATLVVYDVRGRRVATLLDGHVPAGARSVTWDGVNDSGRQVSSGVYFYRLATGDKVRVRKMLLIK
jgi:hypothetical protein